MTKLAQWLAFIVLFLALWLGVIFGNTPFKVNEQDKIWIYLVF